MEASSRPCSKCREVKPLGDFHKHRTKDARRDQTHSQCKECYKIGRRKPRVCLGCGESYVHVGRGASKRRCCPECFKVGKVCSRCDEYKPYARFYKTGSYCKDGCALAVNRESRYGVARSDHADFVKASEAGCPICGSHGRRMALDHAHSTGAIRGIICGKCNCALGMMDDSIDTLLGAVAYLQKHSSSIVK